jgi:hypothetical protein
MRNTLMLLLSAILLLSLAACQKSAPPGASGTSSPASSATTGENSPARQKSQAPEPSASALQTRSDEERYEKVDPKDLSIVFEAALKRLHVDSDERIIEIQGDVKMLRIEGTDIELLTDRIATEGDRAVIATKKYGKIQFTSNSNAQAAFWLTPLQKRQLRSLRK